MNFLNFFPIWTVNSHLIISIEFSISVFFFFQSTIDSSMPKLKNIDLNDLLILSINFSTLFSNETIIPFFLFFFFHSFFEIYEMLIETVTSRLLVFALKIKSITKIIYCNEILHSI